MSIFDRLDRMTSRTVDRVHAKEFECRPALRSPNGRPIADPDRAIWSGRGVVDENPQDVPVEIGRRDRAGNSMQTLVTGHAYELSVDRSVYTQAISVKQGDRIAIAGDTRSFQVVEIKADGLSRIVFGLVEIR